MAFGLAPVPRRVAWRPFGVGGGAATALHALDHGHAQDRFERTITLVGNLTPEQRQHLLEIAERCPVGKTLRQNSGIASLLAVAPPDAAPAA